jgi:hypothetical protein
VPVYPACYFGTRAYKAAIAKHLERVGLHKRAAEIRPLCLICTFDYRGWVEGRQDGVRNIGTLSPLDLRFASEILRGVYVRFWPTADLSAIVRVRASDVAESRFSKPAKRVRL